MDIFEPMVREGYEWINCVNQEDYDLFAGFDGSSRRNAWKPVPVRRVRADEHHGFKASDFPWLGSDALVIRRKAVDALREVLDANGEVLPLSTDDDVELFVLNARIVDALDEANSSLMKFPGTDRIMRIKKIAFVTSKIEDIDLFRLPHRASATYVSARFVERVKAAGLVGLEFKKVWPSD
jgi:hypothetical protein